MAGPAVDEEEEEALLAAVIMEGAVVAEGGDVHVARWTLPVCLRWRGKIRRVGQEMSIG